MSSLNARIFGSTDFNPLAAGIGHICPRLQVKISQRSDGVRPSVWPFSASTGRDLSRKKGFKKKYFVS